MKDDAIEALRAREQRAAELAVSSAATCSTFGVAWHGSVHHF